MIWLITLWTYLQNPYLCSMKLTSVCVQATYFQCPRLSDGLKTWFFSSKINLSFRDAHCTSTISTWLRVCKLGSLLQVSALPYRKNLVSIPVSCGHRYALRFTPQVSYPVKFFALTRIIPKGKIAYKMAVFEDAVQGLINLITHA